MKSGAGINVKKSKMREYNRGSISRVKTTESRISQSLVINEHQVHAVS